MAIRLGNSCVNCESFSEKDICVIHSVKVNKSYTCDTFNMKANLRDDMNCGTCARFNISTCANPQKAAPAMLCSHWAPQASA